MSTAPERPSRTQVQRSLDTRARLTAATLECLHDVGCARTTTSLIARRAEVSRGALTHHYPSRQALLADAVDRLLHESTHEIRSVARDVSAGELDLDGFMDRLATLFRGRLMLITLEHVTEARHDPDLRERLVDVASDFHAGLDAIWREFFTRAASSANAPDVETGLNLTLCLFRGMAVQGVLRDDPPYYERLLDAWKRQLTSMLGATPPGPTFPTLSPAGDDA